MDSQRYRVVTNPPTFEEDLSRLPEPNSRQSSSAHPIMSRAESHSYNAHHQPQDKSYGTGLTSSARLLQSSFSKAMKMLEPQPKMEPYARFPSPGPARSSAHTNQDEEHIIVHPVVSRDPECPQYAQSPVNAHQVHDATLGYAKMYRPFLKAPMGWTVHNYIGSERQRWDDFFAKLDPGFLTKEGRLQSSAALGFYNPERPTTTREAQYWKYYASQNWDKVPKSRLYLDEDGQLHRVTRVGLWD